MRWGWTSEQDRGERVPKGGIVDLTHHVFVAGTCGPRILALSLLRVSVCDLPHAVIAGLPSPSAIYTCKSGIVRWRNREMSLDGVAFQGELARGEGSSTGM